MCCSSMWLCVGTYIDPWRLSLYNARLKENILIDKAEIVVQLGDSSREHALRRLPRALNGGEKERETVGERPTLSPEDDGRRQQGVHSML